MITITKEIGIDMGHRVPYHDSKCQNLHGHRYTLTAEVSAPELKPDDIKDPEAGMICDFGHVKAVMMDEIHDAFDHKFVLWARDDLFSLGGDSRFGTLLRQAGIGRGLVAIPCIPTAENLARFWGQIIHNQIQLRDDRLSLVSMTVKETPTSVARWYRTTGR